MLLRLLLISRDLSLNYSAINASYNNKALVKKEVKTSQSALAKGSVCLFAELFNLGHAMHLQQHL
jgi:hypothetical protein